MKKKIAVIAIVVILAAVVIFLLFRSSDKQIIQSTSIAGPSELVSVLKQTGVIKPQVGAMISIGARATGMLEMVGVKVGDNVTKGQLVARIDSRTIEQNIKQAKDNLKKAQSDLNRQIKVFPVEKSIQENTIKSAKSNYNYLNSVYQREKMLYQKGYSHKETLDKAEHDMISAKTEYEKQKLQLKYMQTDYDTNIVSLKAELNRQKSLLKEQEIQLTYTKIYSPIDGVVSVVNSVQGETIVAGLEVANLITVFRPELLEMYVYIDESDIGEVKEGMEVTYTVDTYPDKIFKGNISRINLQSETKDDIIYYIAIVDISKDDAKFLRPEMTSNVQIVTQIKNAQVTVPSACVKWEAGNQIVYKVLSESKNLTEAVPVKVGLRGEERVEIIEGISDGDTVVVRFTQGK